MLAVYSKCAPSFFLLPSSSNPKSYLDPTRKTLSQPAILFLKPQSKGWVMTRTKSLYHQSSSLTPAKSLRANPLGRHLSMERAVQVAPPATSIGKWPMHEIRLLKLCRRNIHWPTFPKRISPKTQRGTTESNFSWTRRRPDSKPWRITTSYPPANPHGRIAYS